MKIKEIKSEGLNYEFEITIPANDIDKRVDERLQEVGKTMKMPGFRAGKVPLKLLKQKYGKAIMGEVLEGAVNESSAKALKDKNLRAAMQPKIEVKSFDDGKDLVYAMSIEVLPEIKIAEFKGQKFIRPVAKPDAKSLDDALKRLADMSKSTKKIETDRKTKSGDTVVISFDGRTADDNVHHQGMKSDTHNLKLGSGQFIPGFEEQLEGKKSGEKVEVKLAFPKNYGAKELAGRDAIFDVVIKEIHEDAEAEINDEFAANFGMENLDALKKAIEGQLEQDLAQHSRMNLKKAILDYLDEAHQFEVPPTMLEMENQNILDQIELERKRNPDAEKGELTAAEKMELKEIADRRVRLGLILSEIGQKNKITVADQELQKAVIMEAQKYPGQEREVFEYYSKNPQALESLRAPLYEDKVVDYIIELCEVSDKQVGATELMNMLEAGEDEKKAKKSSSKSEAKEEGDKKPAAKKAPAKKK